MTGMLYIIDFLIYEWQNKHESRHYKCYYDKQVAEDEYAKLCNKSYVVKADLIEAIPEKGHYEWQNVVKRYPPEHEDEE